MILKDVKNTLLSAVVQHPYNNCPQLPIAEYVTTNHDQFSIGGFLNALCEMESLKYGNKNSKEPSLILLDYSIAIINACLAKFCHQTMTEYIDCTSRLYIPNDVNKNDALK